MPGSEDLVAGLWLGFDGRVYQSLCYDPKRQSLKSLTQVFQVRNTLSQAPDPLLLEITCIE